MSGTKSWFYTGFVSDMECHSRTLDYPELWVILLYIKSVSGICVSDPELSGIMKSGITRSLCIIIMIQFSDLRNSDLKAYANCRPEGYENQSQYADIMHCTDHIRGFPKAVPL